MSKMAQWRLEVRGWMFHIKIGSATWCDWTGCQAGRDIEKKIGGDAAHIACGYATRKDAEAAVELLRPHFKAGVVTVAEGQCPHA